MPIPTDTITLQLRHLARDGAPALTYPPAEAAREREVLEAAAARIEALEDGMRLQHSLWAEQRAIADAWRLAASEVLSLERGRAAGWPALAVERAERSCQQSIRRAEQLDEVELLDVPREVPAERRLLDHYAAQLIDAAREQLERVREGEAQLAGEQQP
jgi:hypothetical protein